MAATASWDSKITQLGDETLEYVSVTTTGGTTTISGMIPSVITRVDRVIGAGSYAITSGNSIALANIPGNGVFTYMVIGIGR